MERVDGSREALEVAGRLVVATFELRLGDRVAEAIQGGAETPPGRSSASPASVQWLGSCRRR